MGFLFTLLLTAVFFVLSEILKPKPSNESARPADLGDFNFPTATEGRPVPLIWGTVKLSGPNVIWYGDLRQRAIKEKVKTGLFSSSSVTTGFRYDVGIQFGLCRGGTAGMELLRIWVGDDVVYDTPITPVDAGSTIFINEPNLFGGNKLGNGGIRGNLTIFPGTESQLASSYLSPFQQSGGPNSAAPAYRGTFYAVYEQGYVGNSSSIKPWSFEVRRIPNGLGLSAGNAALNGGNDANPMNVIYELITNDEWGFNQPASDVDTADFVAAATTLASENNGFSFVLDREIEAAELLREIERQIDGVVFFNRKTGKWQVRLARGGQTPVLTVASGTNLVETREFTRGAWEDTSNISRSQFTDRQRGYFQTYALAQDMANVRLQGGENVVATASYPGVKDATLANNLAWRDLRTLAFPLAKATIVVDRTAWDVNPGETISWTDDDLGISALQMRVTKVDLGELDQGRIELSIVQDVFTSDDGSFSAPTPSGWTPPADTVVAFPVDESLVFEAPRGFVLRSEEPTTFNRVWATARNQADGAVQFNLLQRTGSASPSGTFTDAGSIFGFTLIGELDAALGPDDNPSSNDVVIRQGDDSVPDILDELATANPADIGGSLANLIYVNGEFLAFETFTDTSPTVTLSTIYRGLLDSAPKLLAEGSQVFLIHLGGGMSQVAAQRGFSVGVKLQPESALDIAAEGILPEIQVDLVDRDRRPYPPNRMRLNSSVFASSHDIDTLVSGGSTSDERGVNVAFTRRDFRTFDEVANVEGVTEGDFPNDNNTRYAVRVINDPDGAATELFVTDFNTGEDVIHVPRARILGQTGGVVPTRLAYEVIARHEFETETFDSIVDLVHASDSSSPGLAGLFNLGVHDTSVASPNPYLAVETGNLTVSLGGTNLSADVQVSINDGAFSTIVPAGSQSGVVAVTVGDKIEVRHQQSSPAIDPPQHVFIQETVAGFVAYGILLT